MLCVLREADAVETTIVKACFIAVDASSLQSPRTLAFVVIGILGLLYADGSLSDEDVARTLLQRV